MPTLKSGGEVVESLQLGFLLRFAEASGCNRHRLAGVGAEDGVGLWLMLVDGWARDLGGTKRRILRLHDLDGWDRLAPLHASSDMLSILALLARLEAHLL